MIERTTQYRRLTEALLPFLVTRQLIAGNGVVIKRSCGVTPGWAVSSSGWTAFCFSQRADYMHEAISSSSTRARPMINTRDEPHSDSTKYRRLHVIVGDSNMSETTQLVRFGTHRPALADHRIGQTIAQLTIGASSARYPPSLA